MSAPGLAIFPFGTALNVYIFRLISSSKADLIFSESYRNNREFTSHVVEHIRPWGGFRIIAANTLAMMAGLNLIALLRLL